LFGTIHISHPEVIAKVDKIEWAIEASDGLYTELSMDLATQMVGLERMVIPDGKRLQDIVPASVYRKLQRFLRKKAEEQPLVIEGISMMIETQKPWAVVMNLSVLDIMEHMQGGVLDQKIFFLARDKGKDVGGIETVDEQIDVFDTLTEREQVLLLEGFLDSSLASEQDPKEVFQKMIESYVAGDESQLMKVMEDQGGAIDLGEEDKYKAVSDKVNKRLLDDRNVLMADRMAAIMRDSPSKTFFFAVGLAHYPGETGVLQLLRDKGFELERVSAEEIARRTKASKVDKAEEEKTKKPAPKGSLADLLGVR
jgi:hypothetical protein